MNAESSGTRERRKLPHRCGQDNCPAKWGYIADGFLYCRNGHHQPDFQQVYTQETERFTASQGQTTRAGRERATSARASRVVTGRSSYYIYLACYQQILRVQCRVLIDSKGFPSTFEQCVKDLWALRLPIAQDRFGSKLARSRPQDSEGEQEDDHEASQTMYSSQTKFSDDETTSGPSRTQTRDVPNVKESIALLYVAAMLLRIPLPLANLQRWTERNEVPCTLAYQEVPPEVIANLETRYQRLLQPADSLESDDLQIEVRKLTVLYYQELKVSTPPLNHQPLIFFHIQGLALPLQLYRTVQYIISAIGLDFSFPTNTQRGVLALSPETQLLAILIVATKLYYPFAPTPPTHARSSTDSYLLTFSWETWSELEAERKAQETQSTPFGAGTEADVGELDVFNFTPQQMDLYMDWFTQAFVAKPTSKKRMPYGRSKLSEQLVNMFPLPQAPAGDHVAIPDHPTRTAAASGHEAAALVQDFTRRIASVTQAVQERNVLIGPHDQKKAVAGTYYQIFRKPSDLEGVALDFHNRAASQCAISLDALLQAVYNLEIKIHNARPKRKR